eukprot:2059524-Amphidinium_carterae.1
MGQNRNLLKVKGKRKGQRSTMTRRSKIGSSTCLCSSRHALAGTTCALSTTPRCCAQTFSAHSTMMCRGVGSTARKARESLQQLQLGGRKSSRMLSSPSLQTFATAGHRQDPCHGWPGVSRTWLTEYLKLLGLTFRRHLVRSSATFTHEQVLDLQSNVREKIRWLQRFHNLNLLTPRSSTAMR